MKKIILMAVVMLSSVATFAQHGVGSLSVTPKVGMNIANFTDIDGLDARIGLTAGAEFEYQATDMFSLTAGALYSMQGAKLNGTTGKFDYINIPVLANVYVAKGLAVKLGLQPGFSVNNDQLEINNYSFSPKTFDLSIPVGISYEYNNFVIDGRYNWGVTKVFDISDAKNSVFQITLGYKFAL